MTGPLTATRRRFLAGDLGKREYIDQMHRHHRYLFDCSDLIRGSEVERIEVTDGLVLMTTRSGVSFACDGSDRRLPPLEALNFGRYEPEDADLMWRLLRPGLTVLDVGANVGWYTLHIAKRHPTSHVHAFEPIPRTSAQLARNLELNGLSNVTLHSHALGESEGSSTFFCPDAYPGAASAVDLEVDSAVSRIDCPVRRLDDVVADLGLRPDFMKCDVEGAELLVMRGARETIKRCRPIIFCEMLRKWTARFGYTPDATMQLLADEGYGCYHASATGLSRLPRMTEDTEATNFVFLHRATHAEMIGALSAPGKPQSPTRPGKARPR